MTENIKLPQHHISSNRCKGLSRYPAEKGILFAIVVLALSLRWWGIDFGLPYIYHPDEPRYVTIAQLLFKTHNLDSNSLPDICSSSFVYVVNALAYVPYYWAGKLFGVFSNPGDIPAPTMLAMGVGHISSPTVFLLGRMLTAFFGIGNVVLVYLIGRQWFKNSAIGLLAAFILAISPTNVAHSRFVTPDTFVAFFALLIFLETIYIYQDNRVSAYILSGIALGCLASTKISGILALFPMLATHFYCKKVKGFLDPKLYLMFLVSGLAFAVTTPYVLGDPIDVVRDILFEGNHYATGHEGMEGSSLIWYLDYMKQTAGLIFFFSALEILRGFYSRSKEIILLSVFPLTYFVFISSFVVRNNRTLLPLTPFLFLLAASFVVYLLNQSHRLQSKTLFRLARVGGACLVGVSLIVPLSKTITTAIRLTQVDSRETARIWIAENLPPGAKIALESYAPFVDPTRFSVQGFRRVIDYEPEWYVENGFDYVVFSQGLYGRFYHEPEKYSMQISQYENFFNQFTLVKLFVDGDYEVRIYQIN